MHVPLMLLTWRKLLLLLVAGAGLLGWCYRIPQVSTFLLAAGFRRVFVQKSQPNFAELAPEWSRLGPLHANRASPSRWMITYHPWYHGFEPAAANRCLASGVSLGVGYLRADIRWRDLMPNGYTVDENAWAWYQAYLSAAHDWYGLKILIVLSNAPREVIRWDQATRLAAWKHYVEEVTRRVGSLCQAYQILNEPNNPVFRIFPVEEVPTAVVSASELIHRQDRRALTTINILVGLWGWRGVLENILRCAGSSVDVTSFDYYPGTWTLSPNADWKVLIDLLTDARSNGKSLLHGRRFAILETGYSTNFPIGRTEDAQVRYFLDFGRALNRLDAEAQPNGLLWLGIHELSDEESRAFLDPEAHFGLLTSKSLDRKAGYTRLQRIIALHP